MGVSVALILMAGAVGVGAIVLLAIIAFDVRRGVDYLIPRYPPLQPGQCAADAHAYHAAQQARLRAEGDGPGTPGRRIELDPSFGKLRPVAQTPSCEDTPVSPIAPETLAAIRAEHRPRTSPLADSGPLALPELRDDSGPGWEHRSGTWKREER